MNDIINLMLQYPIGTSLHLRDDLPHVSHEVVGYEWTANNANLLFRDGEKINIDCLEGSEGENCNAMAH